MKTLAYCLLAALAAWLLVNAVLVPLSPSWERIERPQPSQVRT